MLYYKHYVSSKVACRNTSTECMYVVIQIITYHDEVTYTLAQWCSCGGVNVNEFLVDCFVSFILIPFVY